MTPLFATTGMTTASTIVFILEFLSIVALCIGLLAYRHIVLSHLAFFASLRHAGKEGRQKPPNFLFWLYLLLTLFLMISTTVIYIWQPNLF